MCIITDRNDIVVSVSLIPGLTRVPDGFHVYFPCEDWPRVGEVYKPKQ